MEAAEDLQKALLCPLCHALFTNAHTFSVCGCKFCYECVIATLEGPGISKSECPTCHKPAWKNDLRFDHQVQNAVDHVRKLIQGVQGTQAAAPTGADGGGQQGKAQPRTAAAPAAAAPAAAATAAPADAGGKRASSAEEAVGAAAAEAAGARTSRRRSIKPRRRGRSVPEEGAPAREAQPEQQQQQHQQELLEAHQAAEQQLASAQQPDAAGAAGCSGGEESPMQAEAPQPPAAAAPAGAAAAAGRQEGPAPITPDYFNEEWEVRMLARPPPSPSELPELEAELELLRQAVMLCDQLPCRGSGPSRAGMGGSKEAGDSGAEAAAAPGPHSPLQQRPDSPDRGEKEQGWAEAAAGVMAGSGDVVMVPDSDEEGLPVLAPPAPAAGAAAAQPGPQQQAVQQQAVQQQAQQQQEEQAPPDRKRQLAQGADRSGDEGEGAAEQESPHVSGRKRRKGQSGRGSRQARHTASAGGTSAGPGGTSSRLHSGAHQPPQQPQQQRQQQPAAPVVTDGNSSSDIDEPEQLPLAGRRRRSGGREQAQQQEVEQQPRERGGPLPLDGVRRTPRNVHEQKQQRLADQFEQAEATGFAPAPARREQQQQQQAGQASPPEQQAVAQTGKASPLAQPQQQERQAPPRPSPAAAAAAAAGKAPALPADAAQLHVGDPVQVMFNELGDSSCDSRGSGAGGRLKPYHGRVIGTRKKRGGRLEHQIEYLDGEVLWQWLGEEVWQPISESQFAAAAALYSQRSAGICGGSQVASQGGGSSSESEGELGEAHGGGCSGGALSRRPGGQQAADAGLLDDSLAAPAPSLPAERADPAQTKPLLAVAAADDEAAVEPGRGLLAAAGQPSRAAAGAARSAAPGAAASGRPAGRQPAPDPYAFVSNTEASDGLAEPSLLLKPPRRPSPAQQQQQQQRGPGQLVPGRRPPLVPPPKFNGPTKPSQPQPQGQSQRPSQQQQQQQQQQRTQPGQPQEPAWLSVASPPSASGQAPPAKPSPHAAQQQFSRRRKARSSGDGGEQGQAASPSPGVVADGAAASAEEGEEAACAAPQSTQEVAGMLFEMREASRAAAEPGSGSRPGTAGRSVPQPSPLRATSRHNAAAAPAPGFVSASQLFAGLPPAAAGPAAASRQDGKQPLLEDPGLYATDSQGLGSPQAGPQDAAGGSDEGWLEDSQQRRLTDLLPRPGSAAHPAAGSGRPPSRPCIAISGANAEIQQKVLNLQGLVPGLVLEEAVSERTTHVLIPVNNHGLMERRSKQYLLGLAHGCWVLAYGWVDACLAAGGWVSERNFEAQGSKEGMHAPSKSRQRRSSGSAGLFAGRRVHVVTDPRQSAGGRGKDSTVAAAQAMVAAEGGALAARSERGGAGGPASPDGADVQVVWVTGSTRPAVEAAWKLAQKRYHGRPVVHCNWIYDSLCRGECLDPLPYTMTAERPFPPALRSADGPGGSAGGSRQLQ